MGTQHRLLRAWPLLASGLTVLSLAQVFACSSDETDGDPAANGVDASSADGTTVPKADGASGVDAHPADSSQPVTDAGTDVHVEDAGFDAADAADGEGGGVILPDGSVFDAGFSLERTTTKIGNPLWEIVGCQQFTSFVGNQADGFKEQREAVESVLKPGHVYNAATNLFDPGTPHAPPYDTEVASAMPDAGFVNADHFEPADFSGEHGVTIVCIVAASAGAPTGSSSDFASGPIIPLSLFPMHGDVDVYRNNVLFDPDFDTFFTYATSGAGISHGTLSYGENMVFAPPGVTDAHGNYEWFLHIRDQANEGWDVRIPFVVDD